MKGKKNRSLLLSQLFVYVFMAALAVIALGSSKFIPWFTALRGAPLTGREPLLYLTTYTSLLPAAYVLLLLHRLLRNLGRVSLCCLLAAVIYGLSALYYPSFWMLTAAAAFVSIMLWVLRTVFAQAVELKAENDLTI